jgi:NAD(P)H-hydrate epimerase
LFNDGSLFSGDVTVADIGYPGDAFEPVETNVQLFDESLCYQYLKAPQRDTYKHKQGKVLIIAGAKGFTGAGCLASMGALRSGAGLVVAAVPESLNDIYESKLTEVMTCPLPDRGSGNFHEDCVNDLVPRLGWCDVVAVGPGVGTDDDSKKFLGKLFQLCEKPFVIDADAFSVFQNNPKLFGQFKNEFILTPHFGEASRLMNVDKSNIKAEPINFLHESVQKTGGVWVLKGSPTIVADNLGITINNSGNQGLATSGTGDVLTGLIAGFLAQGIPAEVASKLGVFIHGKAADKLLESHGFKGLIASDLLNIIPGIIRIYEFN